MADRGQSPGGSYRLDPTLQGTLVLAGILLILGLPSSWLQGILPERPGDGGTVWPAVRVEVSGVASLAGIYEVAPDTTLGAFLDGLGIARQGASDGPTRDRPLEDLYAVILDESPAPRLIRLEPMSAGKAFLLGAPMDVNRATAQELELLPGVGPVLASRIAKDRRSRGPFRSAQDLIRVRGVSSRLLGRIQPLLTTGPGPSG